MGRVHGWKIALQVTTKEQYVIYVCKYTPYTLYKMGAQSVWVVCVHRHSPGNTACLSP